MAQDPSTKGRLEEAEDFLRAALAYGPVAQKDVEERARGEGIAFATLKRANKALGVRADKSAGRAGQWMWRLPAGKKTTEEMGEKDGILERLERLENVHPSTRITLTLDDGTPVDTTAGDPDIMSMRARITHVHLHQEAA